jgi:glycosyltransferase involved in cell wall biosynthesis
MRILFLTLDIFRQTGGIQQVNKLLSQALNNIVAQAASRKSLVTTYSLYDDVVYGTRTDHSSYTRQRAFAGSKFRFVFHCLCTILNTDTVILSHIHLLPLARLLSLLKPRLRIMLLAHGAEVQRKIAGWEKHFLVKSVEIWAVSTFTALHLKNKLDHHIRIEVLNNALPPDFIPPNQFGKPEVLLKKYRLQHDDKVLITVCRVGRHEQDKGIDQVIRAIPALLPAFPALSYLILGQTDSCEQLRLEKIIEELHLQSHVSFLHFIPQSQLVSHYLLADAFVMPSKKEGFGLAFIEAAACGCRIIAGNTDGSSDAVLQGKIGTLIDPRSLSQLQDAIINHLKTPWHAAQAAMTQAICLKYFSQEAYQARVSHLLYNPISNSIKSNIV